MSPDPAASVKARLLAIARKEGEEFERTLVRFAMERFLYRLGASSVRERCLLKGASMLSVWLTDPYRATRDIDLLAFGDADENAVRDLMMNICEVSCQDDGLQYDLSTLTVEPIRAEEAYSGKRARLLAFLGKARIPIQVDVGFGDVVDSVQEEIEYPVLLGNLPAPQIRGYPREATVAEKFEAMVNLGTKNSRMKDFHDIWAISNSFNFEGAALRKSIELCFLRRRIAWTTETPSAVTTIFYESQEIRKRWRHYLAGGSVLVPPPADFKVIGKQILRFLGPVRDSILKEEAFGKHWPAGGPWASGIIKGDIVSPTLDSDDWEVNRK